METDPGNPVSYGTGPRWGSSLSHRPPPRTAPPRGRSRRATSCRSSATSRPAAARRARRGPSSSRCRIPLAMASGSPGDTSQPVCPWVTRSATPPTSVESTGIPAAMASMSATGVPSFLEAQITTSSSFRIVSRSTRHPRKWIRSPSPEAARKPLQPGALLSVADDDEVHRRTLGMETRQRLEERGMVLDRHQASHDAEERCALGQTQRRTERRRRRPGPSESLQIQAEWHHLHLLRPTDPHGQELRFQSRTHRHQSVCRAGEPPFDLQKGPGDRPREVALQHVAVKGMDLHRNPGEPGGQSAQRSGLRRVGVHDVRPQRSEEADELDQRRQVPRRVNRPAEFGNHDRVHSSGVRHRGKVPFAAAHHPRHERGDEPGPVQTCREENGVLRRPPDVQPGDDPRHADRTAAGGRSAATHASCSLNQATVSRRPSRTSTWGRYPSIDSAWRIEA